MEKSAIEKAEETLRKADRLISKQNIDQRSEIGQFQTSIETLPSNSCRERSFNPIRLT